MTVWLVAGVLLVVLLAAMAGMDRRARRRGARVRRDIGRGVTDGQSTSAAREAAMLDSQRSAANGIGFGG
jgi:hypothetical protein